MSLKKLVEKANPRKPKGNHKAADKQNNQPRRGTPSAENYCFDYNVNYRDTEKFSLCKRLLSAEIRSRFGEPVAIIDHGEHYAFYPPDEPDPEEWQDPERREIVKIQYGADYQTFIRQKAQYDDRCIQVYHVIWSRCSTAMRNAIKQNPDFERWDRESNALALWLCVVNISMNGVGLPENDVKKQNEARHRFDRMRQRPQESTGDFYDRFTEHYDAMLAQGAMLLETFYPTIEDETEEQRLEREAFEAEARTKEEAMKAMSFLTKLDRLRFQRLLDDLENAFQFGRDEYPTDLTLAYALASRYVDRGARVDGLVNKGEKYNAAFVAPHTKGDQKKLDANTPPGNKGKGKDKGKGPKCFHCEEFGHTRPFCPMLAKALEYFVKSGKSLDELAKSSKEGHGFITINGLEEYIFLERERRPFGDTDVLLDNQASVSIFNNGRLLSNIREAKHPITIAGVGRSSIVATMEGEFLDLGTVYYNPECITNILCFYDVNHRYGVTFEKNVFSVPAAGHRPELRFKPFKKLYICNVGSILAKFKPSSTIIAAAAAWNSALVTTSHSDRNGESLHVQTGTTSKTDHRSTLLTDPNDQPEPFKSLVTSTGNSLIEAEKSVFSPPRVLFSPIDKVPHKVPIKEDNAVDERSTSNTCLNKSHYQHTERIKVGIVDTKPKINEIYRPPQFSRDPELKMAEVTPFDNAGKSKAYEHRLMNPDHDGPNASAMVSNAGEKGHTHAENTMYPQTPHTRILIYPPDDDKSHCRSIIMSQSEQGHGGDRSGEPFRVSNHDHMVQVGYYPICTLLNLPRSEILSSEPNSCAQSFAREWALMVASFGYPINMENKKLVFISEGISTLNHEGGPIGREYLHETDSNMSQNRNTMVTTKVSPGSNHHSEPKERESNSGVSDFREKLIIPYKNFELTNSHDGNNHIQAANPVCLSHSQAGDLSQMEFSHVRAKPDVERQTETFDTWVGMGGQKTPHCSLSDGVPISNNTTECMEYNMVKPVLVDTTAGNMLKYTKREVEKAEIAKRLFSILGRPSIKDFVELVAKNNLQHCPINIHDIKRAMDIWGKDIGAIMGSTTRKKPNSLPDDLFVRTEEDNTVLYVDLFFINGLTFMLSISKGYNLLVVRYMDSKKANSAEVAIKEILAAYAKYNVKVRTIFCDGESGINALKSNH